MLLFASRILLHLLFLSLCRQTPLRPRPLFTQVVHKCLIWFCAHSTARYLVAFLGFGRPFFLCIYTVCFANIFPQFGHSTFGIFFCLQHFAVVFFVGVNCMALCEHLATRVAMIITKRPHARRLFVRLTVDRKVFFSPLSSQFIDSAM